MSSEPESAEQSRQFARAVLAAIKAAGRATDAEVAEARGPSDSYMTQLRNAAYEGAWVPKPRSHTQKRIEAAANWEPGSALKVWEGGEPTPIGTAETARTATVGGNADDADSLLYRRPDGLSDAEWGRLKNETREYLEWLIEKAARER